MCDGSNIITDDDLHATLACVSLIGSPINSDAAPVLLPRGIADSAPGSVRPPTDSGARSFNLGACFTMVAPL